MRVVIVTILAVLLWSSTASAQQWLRLDRLEAEPAYFDGLARVRFYVSAVKLTGDRIPIHGDKAWTFLIGKSKKNVPYIAGHFADVSTEVAIVLVVNSSVEYAESLPMIKKELTAFLEALPATARIAVIGYGSRVKGKRKLYSVKSAVKNLGKLDADTDVGEVQLFKAVDSAVKALRKAKPEVEGAAQRKMVIVLSDGKDSETDDEKFTALAKKSEKEGIPIHTIAFSPTGHREPLLALGELSLFSNGTFRWVRQAEGVSGRGWQPQLGNLLDEIHEQYVITTYLPIADIEGKKLSIAASDIVSNEVKIKTVTCGEKETCSSNQYCVAATCVTHNTDKGGGILGWILMIGGIIVAAIVVLGGVGFVLMRRSEKQAARRALDDAAAEIAANEGGHQVQGLAPGQQPGQHVQGLAPGQQPGQHVQGLAPGQQPYQDAPSDPAPQQHIGRISAFAVPSAGASLIVVTGPNQGARIPLRHGFTIGKAPNCDLSLPDDAFASGHHAQILMDTGGNCTLVDQQSTNGTFVNGVRATEKRLQHGMLIRIGGAEMRFLHG